MLAEALDKNLYKITFLISLLLSALAVTVDPVVNNDGVWYLSVAKVFASGQLSEAIRLDVAYQWPFYPFLIGSLTGLTGLDVELSAWLLNALFASAATVAFVAISRELGGDRQTRLFAALIILTIPLLNDYRSFVIRDIGYWACYTWGLFYFLRYTRTQSTKHAIAWAVCISLGVLFRTESVFFLVLAPLVIFFFTDMTLKQRFHSYLKINTLLIVFALLGLLAIVFVNQAYPDKQLFGLLARHTGRAINMFTSAGDVLAAYAEPLKAGVLKHYSTGFAMGAAILMLVYIFVVGVIKAVTIPYVALWWYSKQNGVSGFSNRHRMVLAAFVVINMIFLCVFLFENAFLVTRYILALVLTLMLCMPFILAWFYSRWKQGLPSSRAGRVSTYVIALLAVILALDAFISTGSSNTYYKKAGHWLGETLQADERLYSSILQVRFYADHIDLLDYMSNPHAAIKEIQDKSWEQVTNWLNKGEYQNYDYVALKIRRRRGQHLEYVINILGKEPAKVFENNKGDRIAIFKIANS